MICNHLNNQTEQIISHHDFVKIDEWNRRPHFVFYEKTAKLLKQVKWLYEQVEIMQNLNEEDLFDIESISIVGKTGTGKTTFCRFFQSLYPKQKLKDRDIIPVVYVKLESQIAGLSGLYSALLEPYGSPISNTSIFGIQSMKIANKHQILKNYIKQAETKIIFIDEFQHVYESRKKGTVLNQAIINHLKLIMEEARVAIIPVGVLSVEDFLNMDTQLVGRCPIKEYSRFDYWSFPEINDGIDIETELMQIQRVNANLPLEEIKIKIEQKIMNLQMINKNTRERFRNLLKGFEANLAFSEPSNLSTSEIASIIFQKIKFNRIEEGDPETTNIRKIAWIIRKVAALSLERKHSKIELEDIQNVLI